MEFENSETSDLEAHNNEKMVIKEKEPYFNIVYTNFEKKKHKA